MMYEQSNEHLEGYNAYINGHPLPINSLELVFQPGGYLPSNTKPKPSGLVECELQEWLHNNAKK